MAAIKNAPNVANNPAMAHITTIRKTADDNGFFRVTTITAETVAINANIEKSIILMKVLVKVNSQIELLNKWSILT